MVCSDGEPLQVCSKSVLGPMLAYKASVQLNMSSSTLHAVCSTLSEWRCGRGVLPLHLHVLCADRYWALFSE